MDIIVRTLTHLLLSAPAEMLDDLGSVDLISDLAEEYEVEQSLIRSIIKDIDANRETA